MKEIIIETLVDSLKLVPFLFLAFFIIELAEHKFSKKEMKLVEKTGKVGPLVGGILGLFPQCGFSVLATNLYVTKIISLGTLISIYLTTSDEMLPILLSKNVEISLILKILLIKLVVGVLMGFLIDLSLNKKIKRDYNICINEECHCKDGILKSTFKHTFNIFVFIILINFILTSGFEYFGHDFISSLFLKNSIFSPFLSSLIGLIPNCASSVMITELYLNDAISFGSMISGLLSGSGVAILILFKNNKNLKENLRIISIIYLTGVLSGIIIDLF